MSFLLDTNVISELRKGPKCNRDVSAWYGPVPDEELFTSVIVLGELRRGIERIRGREPRRAEALEVWLTEIGTTYGDRTLPIDQSVAQEWGRMTSKRPVAVADALLAATAIVYGLTLVTRDDRDVRGLGVSVVNPFR